tara:strand:+ start:3267 stop:4169 length:903 start_codon:yes stop_codon:yes gene_type:complete
MKILVYGGKGWIGNQFKEFLDIKQIPYVISQTRLEYMNDVLLDLEQHKPTHVVSFLGRTHGVADGKVYSTIDYLEQSGKIKDNLRDNLFVPIIIAQACKEKSRDENQIHFTYLGTGCIFTYDDHHPFELEENGFQENDVPNFFGSGYSVVKGNTDQLMHILFNDDCLNLRIRMPITNEENPRNFITKITHYKKICSIKNSMTVLPDFMPIILDLMTKKQVGTLNLTNPGLISHDRILELYKDHVDSNFVWENFTIEEQNEILASARSNNYLDTKKLEQLYPELPDIETSVIHMLKTFKKN